MLLSRAGILLFFLGIISAIVMAALGMGGFYILLVIPVIYLTGPFSVVPVILIIAGMMLIFAQAFEASAPHEPRSGNLGSDQSHTAQELNKKRFGGVIMIGPVPIIFGNDAKWIYIAMGATALILLVLLLHYL
ncbi:MAG: DUF131 domain-containing protein [Candidatus Thermoplasmatota archaeon]|jgi:uncharacterized protein (TIGR00304 family)|nr:DUF131 domain-containing protein [Candidatus Thermoplasmatota archaeon]MCL5793422.1 DUF131 domain-containing protein [Candidatus Thermoplasmatota archaeon]